MRWQAYSHAVYMWWLIPKKLGSTGEWSQNLDISRVMLYQLSYWPWFSERNHHSYTAQFHAICAEYLFIRIRIYIRILSTLYLYTYNVISLTVQCVQHLLHWSIARLRYSITLYVYKYSVDKMRIYILILLKVSYLLG